MPNLLVRVTRYILRSRKRSASLQSSTKATAPAVQLTGGTDHLSSPKAAPKAIDASLKELNAQEPERHAKDEVRPKEDDTVSAELNHSTESVEVHGATGQVVKESKAPLETEEKQNTGVTAIKVSSTSSQSTTVRTRRVLRELRAMLKASSRPENPFQVSLVDESNIFEWDIRLMKVDEGSELWRSMRQTETECIRFRLTFPELFPFQPPFLRLVGPYLDNGFIMDGGAICMEVLTSQGWSSAYTVESLLVQVASGLTQGGAVISSKQKRKYNQLSHKRAEAEFRRICKIHAKYGWVSMEKEDA